jgi:DNA modification methylase
MPNSFLNTYHIGDARNIPDICPKREFVDVTITSPPYWNLRDYGSKQQVGFGQKYEEYLNDLEQIFSAVHGITKKTGSLWIVADTIKWNGELKLFPFDLADRLKNVGWSLHDVIVWHKDKTLPWSHRGKLRNIFEYVLFFSKGEKFKYYLSNVRACDDLKSWWIRYPERYSPLGKAPTRTWSIPIPRQGAWGDNWVRHFCPFPPELVRRIILLATRTGDVVLDPFCGSGVVLAQAKALKRRYVGLDLCKTYRQMFQKKVLPWVISVEASNSRVRIVDTQKRKKFSSLIWRLRKTKYPRELIRLSERGRGNLKVRGAIAFSLKLKTLEVILFVESRSKRSRNRLATNLKRLMGRPPLSKYGLKVTMSVAALDDDERRIFGFNRIRPKTKVSLYKNGKTSQSDGKVSVREFLQLLKDSNGESFKGGPLIASNIQVRIPKGVVLSN